MERPSSRTPLLIAVLLLLAPLLLARELGGSYEQHVRRPLMLASDGDGDGDGAMAPPELDALPGGVGRPGGSAPPAPKPSHGPKPMHEPSPSHGLGSSFPGCESGRQGLAPPSPQGNPPPHYRRSGPAAGGLGALRAFLDALVRYVVGA